MNNEIYNIIILNIHPGAKDSKEQRPKNEKKRDFIEFIKKHRFTLLKTLSSAIYDIAIGFVTHLLIKGLF